MDTDRTTSGPAEEAALDAYSRVVTAVAARVLPSVAALSVRTARGGGAGSAVSVGTDGLLLTSAHVVQGARDGSAAFGDGTETRFRVVGTDPLSDLAVLRVDETTVPPVEWATPSAAACRSPCCAAAPWSTWWRCRRS